MHRPGPCSIQPIAHHGAAGDCCTAGFRSGQCLKWVLVVRKRLAWAKTGKGLAYARRDELTLAYFCDFGSATDPVAAPAAVSDLVVPKMGVAMPPHQAWIAARSDFTPKMFMIRVRL